MARDAYPFNVINTVCKYETGHPWDKKFSVPLATVERNILAVMLGDNPECVEYVDYPRDVKMFIDCYKHGMKHAEVATKYGVSRGALSQRFLKLRVRIWHNMNLVLNGNVYFEKKVKTPEEIARETLIIDNQYLKPIRNFLESRFKCTTVGYLVDNLGTIYSETDSRRRVIIAQGLQSVGYDVTYIKEITKGYDKTLTNRKYRSIMAEKHVRSTFIRQKDISSVTFDDLLLVGLLPSKLKFMYHTLPNLAANLDSVSRISGIGVGHMKSICASLELYGFGSYTQYFE